MRAREHTARNPETGIENRVRQLRKVRGLTQQDLAALLGVTRQTVNAIENGRYDPGLPLAFGIARVFAARVEDVFRPLRRGAQSKPWSSLMLRLPDFLDAGLVRLRPHKPSDLAAFTRFVTDPESTRYMAFTDDQKTEAGAEMMMDMVIASYAGDTPVFSLTIADPGTDAYLGAAGGAEAGEGAMEIYVTLLPGARRKGLAAAALRAMTAYLFSECGASELRADVVEENVASVRLLERLGFRRKGPVQRAAADGPFAQRDMQGVRYVLTAKDYKKGRTV